MKLKKTFSTSAILLVGNLVSGENNINPNALSELSSSKKSETTSILKHSADESQGKEKKKVNRQGLILELPEQSTLLMLPSTALLCNFFK